MNTECGCRGALECAVRWLQSSCEVRCGAVTIDRCGPSAQQRRPQHLSSACDVASWVVLQSALLLPEMRLVCEAVRRWSWQARPWKRCAFHQTPPRSRRRGSRGREGKALWGQRASSPAAEGAAEVQRCRGAEGQATIATKRGQRGAQSTTTVRAIQNKNNINDGSTSTSWGTAGYRQIQFNKCPVAHPFRYRLTLARVPLAPFAGSRLSSSGSPDRLNAGAIIVRRPRDPTPLFSPDA